MYTCAKIAAFPVVQCLLLESLGEYASDKELETEELEAILLKLKESVLSDIRQVPVWNTLGIILLKTGRVEVDFLIFKSVLFRNCNIILQMI